MVAGAGIACAGGSQTRSGWGCARVGGTRPVPLPADPRSRGGLAGLDMGVACGRGCAARPVRAVRAPEDKAGRLASRRAVAVSAPIVRGRTGGRAQLLYGARAVPGAAGRVPPKRARLESARRGPALSPLCDRFSSGLVCVGAPRAAPRAEDPATR